MNRRLLGPSGKRAWIIHVDHIIEKSEKGGEDLWNLWVLCPNCHEKKTRGIILVDLEKKQVFEAGNKIELKQDNHLFVDF